MNKDKANELKVGVVVLVCLVLGLAVALQLSNWQQWLEPKNTLTFKVPYQARIGGIMAGWPVTIGGVTVGSVEKIWSASEPIDKDDTEEKVNSKDAESEQPGTSDETQTPEAQQPEEKSEVARKTTATYTYFTFTVPSKYELYKDCELTPAAQPIGGAGELMITNFGSNGDLLKDGDEVFSKSLGKSDIAKMMDKAKKVMSDVQKIAENFKSVSDKSRFEKIMANIQKFTEKLKKASDKDQFEKTMANIKEITEKLKKASEKDQFEKTMANIQEITENLKSASDKEQFEKIIANIRKATENFKDISDKTRFEKIIADIQKITTDLKQVSSKARETASVSQPQLEKIVANIRSASEEMKQAIREIRWNPWRLLHDPTKRELRTQNLLTAARAFSSGASDVQATTARLEGLLEARGDDMAGDDAELIKAIEELKASMAKFDEAEKTFFKRLGRKR